MMLHKVFSRHRLLKYNSEKSTAKAMPLKTIFRRPTYPWQVAPQQSLIPFQLAGANFKRKNYIYKLSKK